MEMHPHVKAIFCISIFISLENNYSFIAMMLSSGETENKFVNWREKNMEILILSDGSDPTTPKCCGEKTTPLLINHFEENHYNRLKMYQK